MSSPLKIAAMIVLAVLLVLGIAAPALAFPDVPAGHPYATAVDDLSSQGIIGGYANGSFGLNDPVKRAQFAKMIVGALGITPGASTSTRFTDLGSPDANGYPHKFVQAAYDNGITYGTDSAQTLFAPWNSIRRDQVVSMMVRGVNDLFPGALDNPAAGTQSLFTNVPAPHGQNLRIAEYNGLLSGLIGLGPTWSVTATATRGEVAMMLWNVVDLVMTAQGAEDIWVYADGTGDYPTLEAAIDAVWAASAGKPLGETAAIYLGPGAFTLTKTITVFDQELILIGSGWSGANATTVKYAGTVVDVNSGWFFARDISFRCTATSGNADVILTRGASQIGFEGCEMIGGVMSSQAPTSVGSGLCLRGTTTGEVSRCFMSFNDTEGITALDQSDVVLEENQCNVNGIAGIGVYDRARCVIENNLCYDNGLAGMAVESELTPVARGNTCKLNGYQGIAIAGSADITLEDNDCSENGLAGIWYGVDSTGEAHDNVCDENGLAGILVSSNAEVMVQNNECDKNSGDGISFQGDATGEIRTNACNMNGKHGIGLSGNAEVVVEHNECLGNAKSGISLTDDSIGTLRDNDCNDNGMDGIAAWDDSELTAESNRCLRNALNGIRVADNATATATDNECSFSKTYDGIAVLNDASAILSDNVCMGNKGAGIGFYDQSTGAAGGNECGGNMFGILVEVSANPTIETNNLHDNAIDPQLYFRPV